MNKIIHVTFILLSLYYVQVESNGVDDFITQVLATLPECASGEKDMKSTIYNCIKDKADVDISKDIKEAKEGCCVIWVGRDCFSSKAEDKCNAGDKKSIETALDGWVKTVEGAGCKDHKYEKGMSKCGTCSLISNTIFIVCLIIFGLYSQ